MRPVVVVAPPAADELPVPIVPGPAPAPGFRAEPAVRPTANSGGLPPVRALEVIGGLIAMALAATGSGAVGFQSAAAAQARVDAARAAFFPRA